MPEIIVIPAAGETIMEGKLMKWKKNEGDMVKKGDVVCVVETAKIVLEIESPADGKLIRLLAKEEQTVPVGRPIAIIQLQGEELSEQDIMALSGQEQKSSAVKTSPEGEESSGIKTNRELPISGKVRISPVARKLATEHDLDIHMIKGTGPNGRITKNDVLSFIDTGSKPYGKDVPAESPDNIKSTVKLDGVRKIIAEKLRHSVNTKPHIYFQTQVIMDSAIALRDQLNQTLESKISFNSLIAFALVKALSKTPAINAHLVEDEIIMFSNVHLGIAVARPTKGLIVPVVKNAHALGLSELDRGIKVLVKKAKDDNLSMEDISGGTFTISNLGMYAIDSFNAIINPPELGILAVSSIRDALVVTKQGETAVAKTMNINLAVDHAAVDGDMAALFIQLVKSYLEIPGKLLL